MIKQFKRLSADERTLLIQAPELVSVLAASGDKEIDRAGKADAVKLAHWKTFTAEVPLLPYYNQVDIDFKKRFEEIVERYTPFDEAKLEALRQKIGSLNAIIAKLDKEFANTLKASLSRYARHVRKAGGSVLVDFLFPLPIPGLSE